MTADNTAPVRELNSQTFDEALSSAAIPLVVDFWAVWCGPCRMIAPLLEELAQERDDVAFGKLNVDEAADIAARYDVMSIPTLIVFVDGKPAGRIQGAMPKAAIAERIDLLLS